MSAADEGKLVKTTINESEIRKYVYEMQQAEINRYLESSLITQLKTMSKEAEFFLNNMALKFSEEAQDLDISILHLKGRATVELAERDLRKLLSEHEKRELVRAVHNLRGRLTWSHRDRENIPIMDPRVGETWLILHYKPCPKPSKQKLLSSSWNREKRCFVEWLQNIRGADFSFRLLKYVFPEATHKPLKTVEKMTHLSPSDREEIERLRKLRSEFSSRRHKYERIYLNAYSNSQ